jgi:capsular exopolysaccharide synthesis family protein
LIKSAVIDTNPVSPRKFFNYFVGIFIGALLGFIYLLIRLSLDKKVKSQSDLDGIRLLGSIPYDKAAVKDPLLVSSDSYSPRTEAYRTLRASVVHELSEGNIKSVVITSCLPGDGKSTGALNLGYSLSTAGIKVLVVEADLRRPSFNSHLESIRVEDLGHISSGVGLSELLNPKGARLTSSVIQNAIIHTTLENFHILPCRGVPDNPAELLEGPRMPFLIQALEEQYDFVIYDSPPALSVVDSLVLGRLIKKVFLVVHAGSTSKHSYQVAKEAFQEVQSDLTGVIFNKVPKRRIGDEYGYSYSGYKYYRYSHSYKPDKVKPGKRGTLLSEESTAPVLISATQEKELSESAGISVGAKKEIARIRGGVKRLDS